MFSKLISKHITKAELSNAFSLISSNIFKYAINIFISVIVVKYLGASLFGAFSYVNSITSIISVFSGLGLQSIVVKEIILKQKPLGEILGSSFFLSFTSGFIAALIQVILIFIINPSEKIIIYLSLINSFIFLFDTLKIYTYYYEAEVKSRIVARVNNATLIITTLLKILAVYFNRGVYSIALIYVLDYVISGLLILFIFSKNELPLRSLKVKKNVCLDLLRKSSPLILSGLFIGVYMRIDQVLIKNLLGNGEAGIFAVVVRLTEIWYFIPVIIQTTLFPGILKKHQLDFSKSSEAQFRLYKILISFSLFVIFFTTILGPFFIRILFGPNFITATKPLIISIWALLFVSIGVARNAFILSNNLNKLYLYSTLIGAIANIALNLLLLKTFGIVAASITTIISYFISAHLSSFFFIKLRSQFYLVNNVIINIITFNNYKKHLNDHN